MNKQLKYFSKFVQTFSPGRLNDIFIAIDMLLRDGKTCEEFRSFMVGYKKTLHPVPAGSSQRYFDTLCPDCQTRLRLYPVNIPQGKNNVYNYRSVWRCFRCGYEAYSHRTLHQELRFKTGGS